MSWYNQCITSSLYSTKMVIYNSQTYQISNDTLLNPERGFFISLGGLWENSAILPITDYHINDAKSNRCTLLRKYYLLRDFVNSAISQEFLNMILQDAAMCRQHGMKLIPRFSYTWGWQDNTGDATVARTLSHLEQVKPILESIKDVIYFMEAGFIGRWGEWHSSPNNHVDNTTLDPLEGAQVIFSKMLECYPKECPIAIRYPRQKKGLLGNSYVTINNAFDMSFTPARVGHHNDGFRNWIDDSGTYGWTPEMVAVDKQWLSQDTIFTVQGGEPSGLYPEDSDTSCPTSLIDFKRMNWDCMSINQSDATYVYTEWREGGCFKEIEDKLGYRYSLLSSAIPTSVPKESKITIKLSLINQGFSTLQRQRDVYLVLRGSSTEYLLKMPFDMRYWLPGKVCNESVNIPLPDYIQAGTYECLLAFPDKNFMTNPKFSIRLANVGTWEDLTGYNKLNQQLVIS